MDPVAAIGLAGNIVQFLDFSCKLLSGAKGLYNSTTGASDENKVLETVSNDLRLLNDDLTAPSAHGAIPDSIRSLACQCKDVAIQLIEVLDDIKVKGTHRKWSSFVQALRGVWKKEQIEGLSKQLDRLRSEIQIRLQLMMSEKNSDLQKILTHLADENRRLAMDGARQVENLKVGIDAAISNLKSEIEFKHIAGMNSVETAQANTPSDLETVAPSSGTLADLSMKLLDFAKHIGRAASDQLLLDSLWFNNIKDREENVAPSHAKTFEWAIDPSSSITLRDWLKNQNGLYWIMGKAGSGKSTLMKHLVGHPEVAKLLQSWAGPKEIVTASFFFWNAGAAMQKSQEGLFRSILYEVLRKCPDMIQAVCESKARAVRSPLMNTIGPWTRQELWQAIGQLKQQSGIRARFCFFIDGLDEYDGEPSLLVEVLGSLRKWQDIKLCVSSRPWNEFVDAFGQTPTTQLALEDLTREDILIYVRETLEANQRFRLLEAREIRHQELVQEIVDKARGVFLWVVLVVRSLLRGLTNADKFSILQKRLREFPETLEKFFSRMLDSVEPIYQEQTAQFLCIALAAVEPLSLLTYSFLDEDNLETVSSSSGTFLTAVDVAGREFDMERQLDGRCKGLLEVVRTSQLDHYNNASKRKVDFLHRTARDFLLTKDMQTMLAESLRPDFEPNLYLCKALYATLSLIDPDILGSLGGRRWVRLFDDLVYYAYRLEVKLGTPNTTFMDNVGELYLKLSPFLGFQKSKIGFLGFLILRKVHLYVAEALARESELDTCDRTTLLASALRPKSTKYFTEDYDPMMIEILLEHGAAPNLVLQSQSFRIHTAWGNFLSYFLVKTSPFTRVDLRDNTAVIQIIQSMLSHGADRQRVVIGSQDTIVSPVRRLAKRKFGNATVEYRSVDSILRDVLGGIEATNLMSKYKKP